MKESDEGGCADSNGMGERNRMRWWLKKGKFR